jgi:hypothetical protein
MHTLATFRSDAFNTSDVREYFVNPCCFGDDVGKWLIKRLQAQGTTTDPEPGQEDFGWYFDFETDKGPHSCVLSFRPGDADADGVWVLWLEKAAGLIGSLLGRRKAVAFEAVLIIHKALSEADEVSGLRWHQRQAFDAGQEGSGVPVPEQAG